MNYKRVRDDALRLINQYSIAGERIPATYNNQADSFGRLPALIDDAQMLIATTVKPIVELYELKKYMAQDMDAYFRFRLPPDFFRVSGRGLAVMKNGEYFRSHEYHILGKSMLLVSKELFGAVTLEYCRYPRLLGTEPEEDAQLDNTPDTHSALTYYAAAHLAMQDDSFVYAALLNEFEARLERLRQGATAERYRVEDSYGGIYYEG